MIKYPSDCITPAEKTEYCYRTQELLRLDHNTKGTDFKDSKITKNEWETYRVETFDPKQATVVNELLKQRTLLKASTKWNIDIGTI